MQSFRVLGVQTTLHWQDFDANRRHFDDLLSGSAGQADLILLPEMFGSGFTMDPTPVAQEMDGEGVQWLQSTSAKLDCAIMGSLVIKEEQNFLNRLICAEPDGAVSYYDKRHLFTYAGEHNAYSSGHHHLIMTIKGWRILPLVCYDLRFPVWNRNVWNYDLLVYVANWPAPRIDAWKTLLKARAIENQSYVVGVNRIGDDPANTYPGMSCAFDMMGKALYEAGSGQEVFTVTFEKDILQEHRRQFSFLRDMDRFQFESFYQQARL